MLAVVFALLVQQAAPGAVIWETPAPVPVARPAPAAGPSLPASALADPYGYERAQCSPLIRSPSESMEACQGRVRAAFAVQANAEEPRECRQETAGDRYALNCGSPSRPDRPATAMSERVCETRPQARPGGGVAWEETCRADGRPAEQGGLKFRLGGD